MFQRWCRYSTSSAVPAEPARYVHSKIARKIFDGCRVASGRADVARTSGTYPAPALMVIGAFSYGTFVGAIHLAMSASSFRIRLQWAAYVS
jgi:hypothetical protein